MRALQGSPAHEAQGTAPQGEARSPTAPIDAAPAPPTPLAARPEAVRQPLLSQVRCMTAALPQAWQAGASLRAMLQTMLQQAQSLVVQQSSVASPPAAPDPEPGAAAAAAEQPPPTLVEQMIVQSESLMVVSETPSALPNEPAVPMQVPLQPPAAEAPADEAKVPWELPPTAGSQGGQLGWGDGGHGGEWGAATESAKAAGRRRVRTLVESVNHAIDRLPEYRTLADIEAAVRRHAIVNDGARLAVVGCREGVVPGGSPSANAALLALLQLWRTRPQPRQLLLLQPADASVVRQARADGFNVLRIDADPGQGPVRGPAQGVRVVLADSREVCLLCGPRLRPREAMAIAIVGRVAQGDQRSAQQIGELLAEPRVLKIRPSWAIESGAVA